MVQRQLYSHADNVPAELANIEAVKPGSRFLKK